MQSAQDATNIRSSDGPFWIAAHVYVCSTTDGSVVLDLKRDKYYGLGRDDSELLADAVQNWPAPSWKRVAETRHPDVHRSNELCSSLLEDGMLTRNESDSNPLSPMAPIDMTAAGTSAPMAIAAKQKPANQDGNIFRKSCGTASCGLFTLMPAACAI